ncbi:unnamed protein product [Nezara viridula]|uniref:Disease resistance R13L4/SHOC-2-like LRR domain-containing protein n=1 Tax=Nezara viridula TaxID=85310 RepID=A0A9P0MUQ9_NEZVI|nr:unnamed protein product [Nezara viridula]
MSPRWSYGAACLLLVGWAAGSCPADTSSCPCYLFDDGLFLECPDSTVSLVSRVLSSFTEPIQSFSLYGLDKEVTQLGGDIFPPGIKIRHLQISHSNLRALSQNSLEHLSSDLEALSIVSGKLEAVPQKALTDLKTLRLLDLEANEINRLPSYIFYGLSLATINLKGNAVKEMSEYAFAGLENTLTEIDLSENKIDIFPMTSLRRLENLKNLRLSWNEISSIVDDGYSKLHRLHSLDLSSNNFESLTEDAFRPIQNKHLVELRLEDNSFHNIPYLALNNISTLEILILSRNSIGSLDIAQLSRLYKLRELYLNSNILTSLTGFASANFTHLSTVDMSRNSLSALPANFFHGAEVLKRLDLSENRLRQVPTTALSGSNIPSLVWLNLSSNPLSQLQELAKSYPSLQELHISGTNLTYLTSMDFEPFPHLLHLYLGRNRVSRVSPGAFRTLKSLLSLDLGINELEILPQERLHGLTFLRHLNLTHNKLMDLEEFPVTLKALQVIDLSFNQISSITMGTFRHLENLGELYLYGNWITDIASDSFRPLKKLKLLDISRNYLQTLPLNAFRPLETQIRSLKTEDLPPPLAVTRETQTTFGTNREFRIVTIE